MSDLSRRCDPGYLLGMTMPASMTHATLLLLLNLERIEAILAKRVTHLLNNKGGKHVIEGVEFWEDI